MHIKKEKNMILLLLYAKITKKIKNILNIITYKCGFSNNYFMKNKGKPTKTNTKALKNHTKPKNIEKNVRN